MTGRCDSVAIVDDDDALRAALVQALELEGLRAVGYREAQGALDAIDRTFPGIVVTDLRMPGMDGAGLFARLSDLDPDLPVVIITGHGDLPTAVDLMRRGAYDFISKPFSADLLAATVRRALEKRALVIENRLLRDAAEDALEQGFAGSSAHAAAVRAVLRKLAGSEQPVLLVGETGTGKTLCAGLLHRLSPRSARPLVAIDCGTLSAQGGAAFLLGHVSGAFAGASAPRSGALRRADGGTIVLERVHRLPAALQPVVEAVLESGRVVPVGGDTGLPLGARIVATADPALAGEVEAGRFARSLYHRLAGPKVELAPLRDRPGDIPALFGLFLREGVEREGSAFPTVSADVAARLHSGAWPGNAHELRALADEAVLGSGSAFRDGEATRAGDLRAAVLRYEAEYIRAVLADAHGDVEAAREALGLPRKTLYDKMARHGLVAAEFRRR